MRSGAVYVPLNPAYRAQELEFFLDDLAADALAVEVGIPSPAREVAEARGIPVLELEPDERGPAGSIRLSAATNGASKPQLGDPGDALRPLVLRHL